MSVPGTRTAGRLDREEEAEEEEIAEVANPFSCLVVTSGSDGSTRSCCFLFIPRRFSFGPCMSKEEVEEEVEEWG